MSADNSTLAKRFWEKVRKTSTCWLWIPGGLRYGRIDTASGVQLAHRVSWEIHNGPIPEGLYVLHHCDVGLCVNPKHLFLGTQSDNLKDCYEKHRHTKIRLKGENHPSVVLTSDQVQVIRERYSQGISGRILAREYGVRYEQIWRIATRRAWAHI